jgi:hypothetical protein
MLLDNGRVLRKTSPNVNYNSRLEKQMFKQIEFANRVFSNSIKTPRIVNFGIENKLYFFEMDYINGDNPYDVFISGSKIDLDNFTQYLIKYIEELVNESNIIDCEKFISVQNEKLKMLVARSNYKELIDYLLDYTSRNRFVFSESICHGDLTIANMIYSNNYIYLVDFLDSYLNGPVIDLVKLKQDLYHGWSLLISDSYSENEVYRARQSSIYVWKSISKMFQHIINSNVFDLVEITNFLRIEPYISEDLKPLLHNIIKSLTIYEEFDSSYGRQI